MMLLARVVLDIRVYLGSNSANSSCRPLSSMIEIGLLFQAIHLPISWEIFLLFLGQSGIGLRSVAWMEVGF
jgi:hypothetical protein